MPNIKISITFDSEKLAAIRQFTDKGLPSVEEQLQEQLEKLYIKTVPAPVRQYIDGKSKPQEKKKSPLEAGTHRGDST